MLECDQGDIIREKACEMLAGRTRGVEGKVNLRLRHACFTSQFTIIHTLHNPRAIRLRLRDVSGHVTRPNMGETRLHAVIVVSYVLDLLTMTGEDYPIVTVPLMTIKDPSSQGRTKTEQPTCLVARYIKQRHRGAKDSTA